MCSSVAVCIYSSICCMIGSDCHMCNTHTYMYKICVHFMCSDVCAKSHRFVGVDTLAQQWQRMGVEPPHNQSLEDALREVAIYMTSCACAFIVCYNLPLLHSLIYYNLPLLHSFVHMIAVSTCGCFKENQYHRSGYFLGNCCTQ